MAQLSVEEATRLVTARFGGDESAAATVEGPVALDIPRIGQLHGAEEISSALASWKVVYPYELLGSEVRNSIDTESGVVVETRLWLREDSREFTLPVAIVASEIDGEHLVRLYHSERLIHGQRKGRRAVWAVYPDQDPTPLEEFHPAIQAYMRAIASGEASNVTARLAEGGALDNGVRPVELSAELLAIFTAMVRTGGARLVRQHEFDNGSTVALEYTGLPRPGVEPGAPRTPPGGGIGIYDYDAQGFIRRVRMYDDFDPEALIAAGAQ